MSFLSERSVHGVARKHPQRGLKGGGGRSGRWEPPCRGALGWQEARVSASAGASRTSGHLCERGAISGASRTSRPLPLEPHGATEAPHRPLGTALRAPGSAAALSIGGRQAEGQWIIPGQPRLSLPLPVCRGRRCCGSWRRTSWTSTPRWRSCPCSRRPRTRTTACACGGRARSGPGGLCGGALRPGRALRGRAPDQAPIQPGSVPGWRHVRAARHVGVSARGACCSEKPSHVSSEVVQALGPCCSQASALPGKQTRQWLFSSLPGMGGRAQGLCRPAH